MDIKAACDSYFYPCFLSLVKIPELQENMFQLATEMERAGLVEEIVSDGLALTDVRINIFLLDCHVDCAAFNLFNQSDSCPWVLLRSTYCV